MAMMGKNKDMFGTMAMMSMFGGQSKYGWNVWRKCLDNNQLIQISNGCGSYDYIASSTRSRSYANQSRETVFHNESYF